MFSFSPSSFSLSLSLFFIRFGKVKNYWNVKTGWMWAFCVFARSVEAAQHTTHQNPKRKKFFFSVGKKRKKHLCELPFVIVLTHSCLRFFRLPTRPHKSSHFRPLHSWYIKLMSPFSLLHNVKYLRLCARPLGENEDREKIIIESLPINGYDTGNSNN